MRVFVILVSFILSLVAGEYYSRAYPIEEFHVKSAVSGLVTFSDEYKEGKFGDGKSVIMIDSKVDKEDLNSSKEQLKLLKELIKNSQKQYDLDKSAYERIAKLSTYSKTQKDLKLAKMLASQTALINQKINLSKLKVKIATLEDRLDKKNIRVSSKYYIQKVYPRKGDFVNFGSPLIDVADLSKVRLVIFVTSDDLEKIKNGSIMIDGKKQKYKIVKILKVADNQNLSGYKVMLEIAPVKIFSKLIKVEIR